MWGWKQVQEKFGAIAPRLKAGARPALYMSMAVAGRVLGDQVPMDWAWAVPLATVAAIATDVLVVLCAHRSEEAISALSKDSSNHDLELAFAIALRETLAKIGKRIAKQQPHESADLLKLKWFDLWDRRLERASATPEDASLLFYAPDPTREGDLLWPGFEEDLVRWAGEQQAFDQAFDNKEPDKKGPHKTDPTDVSKFDVSALPQALKNALVALPEEIYTNLRFGVRNEGLERAWVAWQQRFLEESVRIGIALSADVTAIREQLTRMEGLLLAHYPPHRRRNDPTEYLRRLTQETEHIDIEKLRVPDGSVKQFHITELYTPLTTVLAPEEPRAHDGKPDHAAMRSHRPELLQDSLRHHRLLLIGDPGSGKSTFLKRIAFDVCDTLQTRPGESPGMIPGRACPFPILISAFSFAEFVRKATPVDPSAPGWAVRFLASQQHFDLDEEYFRERLREGCLLMVDGLDEVTDWSRREFVGFLEALAQVFTKTQIVATSRPASYGGEVDIPGFKAVKVGPLEPDAIRLFVEKWFGALKRPKDREGLLEAIESRPEIEEMASNPVMLTALAALQSNGRRIPEQRSELYDSILLWLAEAKEKFTRTLAVQRLSRFRRIAYAMSADPRGKQIDIPRLKAAAEIRADFAPGGDDGDKIEAAERFLKEEETYSGIVVSRGNLVKFWHLTFQEHLAAQFLRVRRSLLFEKGRLYDRAWRETVLLLAGLLYEDQPVLDEFVSEALDRLSATAALPERAACVGLIGSIVRDLRVYRYQPADPRYEDNLARCLAIFKEEAAAIPFETRLEAAEALGLAGDPRLHHWDNPDNWVTLDGGKFWMGAQKAKEKGRNYDPEAFDDEGPVREIEVEGFRMGRYPVTVAEYESFINHKGYTKEGLWKAGGFDKFKEPEDWAKQLPYKNRPVVGVSWYEAVAYCASIGARLPSEIEWEYAARYGREGARYPWGNETPDATRANYGDHDPQHATPVGLYQAGATSIGIQDMTGNVWEWTASDFSKETGDARTVRGGAWSYVTGNLRVSCRYSHEPVERGVYLGFRCVRELLCL